MLKSLHIRNFRGIESLDIEDLGRVNLLIGRNNSGKTSLMEAAVYAGAGALQENLHTRKGPSSSAQAADPLRSIFPGGESAHALDVSSVESDGTLHRMRLQAGAPRDGRSTDYILEWDGTTIRLESKEGNLYGKGLDSLARRVKPIWLEQSDRSLAQARQRFQQLFLAGTEDEVIAALRPVEPGLQSIDPVGDELWFKLAAHRQRLPLSVLGDGALWLFALAVALRTPAGLVCADELDAGLHPATLDHALRLVQQGRPETQIFATTHSDECIRAACEVFRDADDPGLRIIRLDRTESGHRAAVYHRDAALFALENGWEIRG